MSGTPRAHARARARGPMRSVHRPGSAQGMAAALPPLGQLQGWQGGLAHDDPAVAALLAMAFGPRQSHSDAAYKYVLVTALSSSDSPFTKYANRGIWMKPDDSAARG